MNNTDLDDLATRAGFAVNMLGEIVTPAPTEDARKPLRMFAELLAAAERERLIAVLQSRLDATVMSVYATTPECEAARAALRHAMLDVWAA